jgi:aminoglycoside phosphotransferase
MTGTSATGPELMPHGYTHRTTRAGNVVTKAYQGPAAEERCAREAAALTALAGLLPVPRVIARGSVTLLTELAPGRHGQDLIAGGLAEPVLAACGRMLRQVHRIAVPTALSTGQAGAVIVHGDFGPNNVLLDTTAQRVTAVLDWEWAHAGDPVEDLAWCEFIIRLHHPAEVASLAAFYASYGERPGWPQRHEAIMRRCAEMRQLCERWEPGGASARAWGKRIDTSGCWRE